MRVRSRYGVVDGGPGTISWQVGASLAGEDEGGSIQDAATACVAVTTHSRTEPPVLLKHFGHQNPELPSET